jgi:hypothetical protein
LLLTNIHGTNHNIQFAFDSQPKGGTVPRLTKSEIEGALLAGSAVPWVDSAGKSAIVQLATARQRRLFQYLLRSQVREVKALPQAFVDGLATAYVAVGDPAAPDVQQTVNPSAFRAMEDTRAKNRRIRRR